MTDYPTPEMMGPKPRMSSLTHLLVTFAVGAVIGLGAARFAPWQVVPMLVWDGTALSWLISVWWRVARLDAAGTSAHATYEDPRRATADVLLLSACVASLAGVLVGIIKAGNSHGTERLVLVTTVFVTIIVSWASVHTLFTLRYAALFYRGPDGGIDFNQDEKPRYADFAYVALTIGMTYQVSDTSLTAPKVRHTALRHALLSYLFGTVIIAATINLAAGLAK